MPPNTSATGGPLVPSSAAPTADLDLDVFFGRLVRGISGLPDGLVRPRWQENPPDEPEPNVDWASVGVMRSEPEGPNAEVRHDGAGDGGLGTSTVRRHEILELMASFYGPGSYANATRVRDGLALAQNLEPLFHAGMGLIAVDAIVQAGEPVNTVWRRRQDLTFRVRRRVDRTYPVRNLLEAQGALLDGSAAQSWSTEN